MMALALGLARALLETAPGSTVPGTPTPLWVPLLILGLVLLLLWWGLTRGRVYDENLPSRPAAAEHEDAHETTRDHH